MTTKLNNISSEGGDGIQQQGGDKEESNYRTSSYFFNEDNESAAESNEFRLDGDEGADYGT